jgi:hypothetical protein
MKKVENKKISFLVEQFDQTKGMVEIPVETTYIELMFNTCKRPEQGGYSWEMIEKIGRVKDIYENNKTKIGETIDIEDADFAFMKERFLSNNSWMTYDKNLVEMKKYIESIN